MAHANNKSHDHIDVFNPDVKTLRDSYQDFLFKIKQFDAGNGYQNFNEFISDEAIDYADDGNGVTYVVWNILNLHQCFLHYMNYISTLMNDSD